MSRAKPLEVAGFFVGGATGVFIGARGLAAQPANDLCGLHAEQVVVVGCVECGELFHPIRRLLKPFHGFDPEGTSREVVFEDVVGNCVRQRVTPTKPGLGDAKVVPGSRLGQAHKIAEAVAANAEFRQSEARRYERRAQSRRIVRELRLAAPYKANSNPLYCCPP